MDPFFLDVAGHLGYACIALGMFLLTKKSAWGFAMRFVGEIIWLVVGVLMNMSSIWTWGLLFLAIDAHGFFKWRRDESEPTPPVETMYGEFKRKGFKK